MTINIRKSSIIIACLVLALIVLFLKLRTNSNKHPEKVRNQIQSVIAQEILLEKSLLEVRFGMSASYDPLTENLQRIRLTLNSISRQLATFQNHELLILK